MRRKYVHVLFRSSLPMAGTSFYERTPSNARADVPAGRQVTFERVRAQDAFLTAENAALANPDCVNGEGGSMVAPKSLLEEGPYSREYWLPVQPLGKRALHPRLIRLASLIGIVLVSLGLWVAISEAVISIASVR